MFDEFEEEDAKLERFKSLGESLNEDPDREELSLVEHLEEQKRHDQMLNSFIESYRSGEGQIHFMSLNDTDQKMHIHLLEISMIIARKKGNMLNYYEMKEIVTKLKYINEQ